MPIVFFFFQRTRGLIFVFFFSSRRRHTRCSRDWSSDVCSSDLAWSLDRVVPKQLGQVSDTFHTPIKAILLCAVTGEIALFALVQIPQASLLGALLAQIAAFVVGNLTIDDVVLPTGVTRMARLGGNSVHAATAVVTAGAKAALIARRGDDFPRGALTALAEAGVDLGSLVEIAGPTVRNWVIYEEDGSRRWLYRTPADRSEQVAPQP